MCHSVLPQAISGMMYTLPFTPVGCRVDSCARVVVPLRSLADDTQHED